ncbi:unnamed protein product, partial [Porites evermanni]
PSSCNLESYVDDSKLFLSFPLIELDEAIEKLEQDLLSVAQWCFSRFPYPAMENKPQKLKNKRGYIPSKQARVRMKENNAEYEKMADIFNTLCAAPVAGDCQEYKNALLVQVINVGELQ